MQSNYSDLSYPLVKQLLKNWLPASWNVSHCNKIIFFGYPIFRGDINIFMQPFFLYFGSALRFEYYFHKHLRFWF